VPAFLSSFALLVTARATEGHCQPVSFRLFARGRTGAGLSFFRWP